MRYNHFYVLASVGSAIESMWTNLSTEFLFENSDFLAFFGGRFFMYYKGVKLGSKLCKKDEEQWGLCSASLGSVLNNQRNNEE